MDRDTTCHNIALACAKTFTDSNLPEYKVCGYEKLVEDFTTKYIEAYKQAEKQINNLPKPKIKTKASSATIIKNIY